MVRLHAKGTGIADAHVPQTLAPYPNPTGRFLNVGVEPARHGSSFRITDMAGRSVLQGILLPYSPIDMGGLEKGIYLVIIDGQRVWRVVKE